MFKFFAKDFINITSWKHTENGYLLVKVAFAKWGLQERLGSEISEDFEPNKVYKELRPKSEVLKSVERWGHVVVTNDHPEPMLDVTNTAEFSVGYPCTEVAVDEKEKALTCELLIFDAHTIDEIKNGKSQLSAGYYFSLEKVAGESYDFIQKDITPNHIAIVERGKCGKKCSIAKDNQPQPNTKETKLKKIIFKKLLPNGEEYIISEVEVPADSADAVQKTADKIFNDSKTMLEASKKTLEANEELKTANDKLQAQLDNVPTPAKDADVKKQVEAMADARLAVVMVARDADITTDNKSDAEIKKEVIKKYSPQIALDGKSDAYIDASFDLVAENLKAGDSSFLRANDLNPTLPKVDNEAETDFNSKY